MTFPSYLEHVVPEMCNSSDILYTMCILFHSIFFAGAYY